MAMLDNNSDPISTVILPGRKRTKSNFTDFKICFIVGRFALSVCYGHIQAERAGILVGRIEDILIQG
jgi:hypothetical protein